MESDNGKKPRYYEHADYKTPKGDLGRSGFSGPTLEAMPFDPLIGNSISLMRSEVHAFMCFQMMSLEEACEIVGLDPEDYKAPSPQSQMVDPLPTPEDIERACQQIRSNWSEEDHMRRRGREPDDDGSVGWTVPFCDMSSYRR